MEYYATTKNELLLPAVIRLNLTDFMLLERSQNKGNHEKLVYAGIYDDIVIIEFREMSPLGEIDWEGAESCLLECWIYTHLYLGSQYPDKN